MTSLESKFESLIKEIEQDISSNESKAVKAMEQLENMNVSSEEYKKANYTFSRHSFIANYLKHILATIKDVGSEMAENIIRYHAHAQHVKGGLSSGGAVSTAQAYTTLALDGYVERFFNDTPQAV